MYRHKGQIILLNATLDLPLLLQSWKRVGEAESLDSHTGSHSSLAVFVTNKLLNKEFNRFICDSLENWQALSINEKTGGGGNPHHLVK